MIDPSLVSAVLVTRGNVPMDEIIDSIHDAGITDVVIWDNSIAENLSCYGRYAGIAHAKNEYIFHQDDDLVAPVADILAAYRPDRDRDTLVSNNRIDEEWPLTGIGSIFHRDLADGVFDEYIAEYGAGPEFHRICDVVFAYSVPYRRLVLGYRDLPWATDPTTSMYHEQGHMHARQEARRRTFALGMAAVA